MSGDDDGGGLRWRKWVGCGGWVGGGGGGGGGGRLRRRRYSRLCGLVDTHSRAKMIHAEHHLMPLMLKHVSFECLRWYRRSPPSAMSITKPLVGRSAVT